MEGKNRKAGLLDDRGSGVMCYLLVQRAVSVLVVMLMCQVLFPGEHSASRHSKSLAGVCRGQAGLACV